MGKIMKNGIEYSASSNSAVNISYDGTKNVKEAIDDVNSSLSGCSFEQEGEDFFIVGADSVRKKLGSGEASLVKIGSISLSEWSTSNSTNIDCTNLKNYQYMTKDHFAVVLTNCYIHVWQSGGGSSSLRIDRSGSLSFSKSYNASTGILTVTINGTAASTYHGGGTSSYTTTTGSGDIYAIQ